MDRNVRKNILRTVEKYCDVEDIFFIQVGSNDGVRGDPISKLVKAYNWKGILIEPQPDAFKSLKRNYSKYDGLIFECLAIHIKKNTVKMYKNVKDSRITSLIRNNRSLKKISDKGIKVLTVKATTLDEIIEKHSISKIDLLLIDAEGYDFEVIKSMSLDKNTPKIICYEHCAFSKKKTAKINSYLSEFGYSRFIRLPNKNMMAVR